MHTGAPVDFELEHDRKQRPYRIYYDLSSANGERQRDRVLTVDESDKYRKACPPTLEGLRDHHL